MDRTPKNKSLRLTNNQRKNIKENKNETPNTHLESHICTTSTPIRGDSSNKLESYSNDQFYICSQGGNEDIDVVWDWNSPQAKVKPKDTRAHKKLNLGYSPVAFVKKQPSNNNKTENYEKLRDELQALRDQIAKGNEDCLPLSPLEETHFKDIGNNSHNTSAIPHLIEQQQHFDLDEDFGDLFNNSADEQLILCTQQIESKFCDQKPKINFRKSMSNEECSTSNIINRTSILHKNCIDMNVENKIEDDSFDVVLQKFGDKEIELLSQTFERKLPETPNTSRTSFKRTHSDANVGYNSKQKIDASVCKFELYRTHSFEVQVPQSEMSLSKNKLEEIEKNRKEAIARREAKRKGTSETPPSISPMKCSPEEIEQKRLQALAKLEAKKRDIIEQNRLEALKRLEISRLRRTGSSSFLSK